MKEKKIIFKLKIITPLFIGGAQRQAELRTQSFNGMFRYWFRIAGGSLEDEKKIFGWGGDKGYKKLISLIIYNKNLQKEKFTKIFNEKGYVNPEYGINYLGFALDQRRRITQDKPQREYLKEGQTFTLEIKFHPLLNDKYLKKFLCSVWLAFNIGNFGSRARRGFGSIKIESVEGNILKDLNLSLTFSPKKEFPAWLKENLENIKNIIQGSRREDIPYLFDSDNFKIYRVNKNKWRQWEEWRDEVQEKRNGKFLIKKCKVTSLYNWEDILNYMGFLLAAYRSYYQPDYGEIKSFLTGKNRFPQSEKVIFGLPLNFYFSSLNQKTILYLKKEKEILRRASPLWIKIIEINSSEIEGLFLVMKSTYFPSYCQVIANNVQIKLPSGNLWKALDEFISSLEKYEILTRIW